jgi:hypothetical protein
MGYNRYMIFKDKELNVDVEIVSTIPHIINEEHLLPRPAKNFMPDWWKNNIPKQSINERNSPSNVLRCPSFPDYFSQGFIIPMWTDMLLNYDSNTTFWNAEAGKNLTFEVTAHPNSQFIDHVTPSTMGIDGQCVFKAISPWRVITPPGWSLLQLPLFYHFNKDWSILPGVIDTDIWHEINQQILYHGDGKNVLIEQGTPFVHYIPFKRSKSKLNVEQAKDRHRLAFDKAEFKFQSSLQGHSFYRKMQRERDKGER